MIQPGILCYPAAKDADGEPGNAHSSADYNETNIIRGFLEH